MATTTATATKQSFNGSRNFTRIAALTHAPRAHKCKECGKRYTRNPREYRFNPEDFCSATCYEDSVINDLADKGDLLAEGF